MKASAFLPALVAVVAGGPTTDLTATVTIERHGISWTLDREYPSGVFANGDPWVVGPVELISISPSDPDPNDSTDLHGSVINPKPAHTRPYAQSWDSRIGDRTTYDPEQNIAPRLPLHVEPGSSVVSVRSDLDGAGKDKLFIDDAAVLTVLASAPQPGSFRPPYAGADKTIPGTAAELDLGIFRSLRPPPSAPPLRSFKGAFEQPMLDVIAQWPNSSVKNAHAGPPYGRDIARQVADAVLVLNLNHSVAEKHPLLVRLVQRGIDTYGLAKAGMVWVPNGGHNVGRKLPVLIAAKALHHADMLAWCDGEQHRIFQEDTQHFVISPMDVSTPRGRPDSQPYTSAMVGLPEWASNPLTERTQTGAEWPKPYRIMNGNAGVGLVLAAEIMGLRREWNWEPLFNYITDRYWPAEGIRPSTKVVVAPFHREMWKTYHPVSGTARTDLSPRTAHTLLVHD